MLNKKGQMMEYGIISFVGIVIIMLLLAPFLINIVTTVLGEFGTELTAVDAEAGAAVTSIETTYTNLWDIVIILLFVLNVLLLFISAFLVDTHPVFFIMYILFAFFTVMFVPNVLDVVNEVYDHSQYAGDVGLYLQFTEFILNNFMVIILGILILSGIIMYAKFKFLSRGY
jgi:hypothetical protein